MTIVSQQALIDEKTRHDETKKVHHRLLEALRAAGVEVQHPLNPNQPIIIGLKQSQNLIDELGSLRQQLAQEKSYVQALRDKLKDTERANRIIFQREKAAIAEAKAVRDALEQVKRLHREALDEWAKLDEERYRRSVEYPTPTSDRRLVRGLWELMQEAKKDHEDYGEPLMVDFDPLMSLIESIYGKWPPKAKEPEPAPAWAPPQHTNCKSVFSDAPPQEDLTPTEQEERDRLQKRAQSDAEAFEAFLHQHDAAKEQREDLEAAYQAGLDQARRLSTGVSLTPAPGEEFKPFTDDERRAVIQTAWYDMRDDRHAQHHAWMVRMNATVKERDELIQKLRSDRQRFKAQLFNLSYGGVMNRVKELEELSSIDAIVCTSCGAERPRDTLASPETFVCRPCLGTDGEPAVRL